MTRKVLEVLIPTYGRPQAAIGAIHSVLACEDPRIGVFCHSNGLEPELEAAVFQRERVRFGSFPENRGMVANFRKVLADSEAEYVLYLSDEDRLDPRLLSSFVDFLACASHSFVLCSILENTGANYFSVAALQGETLSLSDLLLLFPIDPTYLSGYCFRRDLLTEDALTAAFEEHEANVYPHVMLRNAIVNEGTVGLFAPPMVRKGAEANTGGDSHAHLPLTARADATAPARAVLPLNPRTYGESARAKQFYYLLPRLKRDAASLSPWKRSYAKLYVLSAWLHMTSEAHKHVASDARSAPLDLTLATLRANHPGADLAMTLYSRVLSISQPFVRRALVACLWNTTKILKLMLFVGRFGRARTADFLRTRRG